MELRRQVSGRIGAKLELELELGGCCGGKAAVMHIDVVLIDYGERLKHVMRGLPRK